jgi:hypothetical protein
MSGPKRGTWRFVYDPTPTRLADLSQFAARQTAWLGQHGEFLRRFLGSVALERAVAAWEHVAFCIAEGDPDTGFEAYGAAWALFNQLYRDAAEAQRRRRIEEQARAVRAADSLVRECRQLWEAPENQALVQRWVDERSRCGLASALSAIGASSLDEVKAKALAWQGQFAQALRLAGQRAAENARAVKAVVPALRAATQAVGALNADILPRTERRRFEDAKARLREEAEEAVTREDIGILQNAATRMKALVSEYEPKLKAAQLKKATEIWRSALVNCGYGVTLRTDSDGTMVIEASSFPMKAVNVRVRPDSEEVNLEVNGAHSHAPCVKDVQLLQAELARQGVTLTMTDWGKGGPGGVRQQQGVRTSIGGGT